MAKHMYDLREIRTLDLALANPTLQPFSHPMNLTTNDMEQSDQGKDCIF